MSNNPKGAGPLWIISLFLTLTETVAGIAATQVSGGIQIAFTAFAVALPVLVAAAFFYILWNRPEVLYPPDEKTSVVQFIKAQKEARSQFSASEVQPSNMITEKRGELERALTE